MEDYAHVTHMPSGGLRTIQRSYYNGFERAKSLAKYSKTTTRYMRCVCAFTIQLFLFHSI
jgi:hypothetical protein